MQAFTDHAKSFGAEIVRGEVTRVDMENKAVHTKAGETYEGKTIVLAPGAVPRKLNIPGEAAFTGKGVSYCATCDADFYEDLDVIVLGNGDAAVEEAGYLTKFANSVTIVVIHDEGILDAAPMLQERAFNNPKIKWIWNSTLAEIKGDALVNSVVVKNIKTNELTEMPIDGVFIYVGTVPQTDFLKDTGLELDSAATLSPMSRWKPTLTVSTQLAMPGSSISAKLSQLQPTAPLPPMPLKNTSWKKKASKTPSSTRSCLSQ